MFVNIGFGNYINSAQIVSVCRADSAPVKRLVSSAKEKGCLVDATQGRKTKAVITAMNGQLILSALLPETITARCVRQNAQLQELSEESEDEEE